MICLNKSVKRKAKDRGKGLVLVMLFINSKQAGAAFVGDKKNIIS